MPSKQSHIAAAVRNQRTLDYLLKGDDEHLGWVVSVAFYKALHVVEAVFAADTHAPCQHSDDHRKRNTYLKKTNRYKQLWRMYRPLYEASLVARYLQHDGSTVDCFSAYMPRQAVEGLLLGHNLRQTEATAAKLLGVADIYA